MKIKSYKQIILFLIIFPIFIGVILPFFVILKIAFIPEGLAKSDNKELIIWKASKNYNPIWEHNKANLTHELIESEDNIYGSFSWDLKSDDSYIKWVHTYAQSFLDFRDIVLKLNSSVPEIILGFKDIHDKEISCEVKIKKTNSWINVSCPLKNFDFEKIDKMNIKHIFVTVKPKSSGTLMIKKVFCPYRLFTISNFKEVLSTAFFGRYFLNSAFYSNCYNAYKYSVQYNGRICVRIRFFSVKKNIFCSDIADDNDTNAGFNDTNVHNNPEPWMAEHL